MCKMMSNLIKRRCKSYPYTEKKLTTVAIKNASTMQRECAITVTINMEGPKNLGTALMISYMQMECARTATSTLTIAKEERREPSNELER